MMEITRRGFLRSLTSVAVAVSAPTIVTAANLMPIRPLLPASVSERDLYMMLHPAVIADIKKMTDIDISPGGITAGQVYTVKGVRILDARAA